MESFTKGRSRRVAEGPDSLEITSVENGACRASLGKQASLGATLSSEDLAFTTPSSSNPPAAISLQGYPGRPPTSSWPVVPLPRPIVDNCRSVHCRQSPGA
jgi:hypothetical protein